MMIDNVARVLSPDSVIPAKMGIHLFLQRAGWTSAFPSTPLGTSARVTLIARFLLIVAVLTLGLSALTEQLFAQEIAKTNSITTPPTDSAEAERVRIWIPIEMGVSCRVAVKVLAKDGSGSAIRTLVEKVLSPGQYVDSGVYPYSIDGVCGLKKRGSVRAEYKDWERLVEVLPPAETNPGGFGFQLLRDSARVTIDVFSGGNMRVNTPLKDSLMHAGRHEFVWPRPEHYPATDYWCWLTVGDFTQKVEFRVKP